MWSIYEYTLMTEYRLKITGVHYAANPDQVAGQPDTEAMHVRTREMLSWVENDAPFVVLKADPECHQNHDAVAARVLGRRIGYVGDDWLQVARSLLAQSGEQMVMARVAEVTVKEHGWLWVTVDAQELKALEPLSSMEIEWKPWLSDLPLLPPSDDEEAEQEAAFVLDRMLTNNVDGADLKQLEAYLDIWLRGSRHDLSRETRQKRSLYIERLESAASKEIRQLAKPLKQQRTSICGRTMLNERTGKWWQQRMASLGVQRLWQQWQLKNDGHLWSGLRWTDDLLRQLPGGLYEDIGRLDEIFSRLYYMNTPRRALRSILALMMLRELTCRELKIEMRPMTERDYGQDGVITNPLDMPTTIGRVREFERTQCSLPIQQQTIQTLCLWLREDYEKESAVKAETAFDGIFHQALNLTRVKMVISDIIAEKGDQQKHSLSVKQTFILHKVLEEIDWLDDDTDTTFIQWFDDVFKWPWETRNFKSVKAGFKHSHSTTWDENTVNDPNTGREYRQFADYVREQFVSICQNGTIEDKVAFMKLGSDGKPMYIGHGLKRK